MQLKADADADWSKIMRAINPLQRKGRTGAIWTGAMEKGAWFAGDPEFGGVIAVPGGGDLMTLERDRRTPVEAYLEIARDKDRMARDKRAGIGSLSGGRSA
ncbi:hypothetical protein [Streptomyces sp. ISL-100]|uniref:hypothetical protein n=1 Tax=Streptomyces sp. ISL-100 TaxID=2819173 RepID=UPI001BECF290|nr:hypothetical protein [Streptomyces sp. ISL-100]MBT2395185.1 hypothetical protein [Streptomyces sp. ISL-100]